MKNLHAYRWIAGMAAAFLAFLIFFIPSVIREAPSRTAFSDVVSAVTGSLDMTDYPQADQSVIRSKLGLEPSDYSGIAYYRSGNAMKAEEMLLIQYDPAQAESVRQAVEKRIDSQETVYEGYAPDQLAMMQNAVVSSHPNYLLYMTGSQTDKAVQAFEAAL